jgi:EAL domain-containing protein (putative c-di-GMP-specific phosphodiesterase class I)
MLLALQPIVSSGRHAPELYECLLRMKRLDGTIVVAGEFIQVAERFGLAKLIDHRVLELAIDLLRASPTIKLALNVSAATATDQQWVQSLKAFTGGDRSLTGRLTVEITETAAISDLDETVKFVGALKALGVRVALDDFGAGYTSFRSLRRLGVDMVKIDGSFIQNLATHAEDELFVRTLIELARDFGMETVGEWVGDEMTAQLLEAAGVGYMQGYFLRRAAACRGARIRHPARGLAARGEASGKRRQRHVVDAGLFEMKHRVQHIVDIGAREARRSQHEFGLPLEGKPPRILRMGAIRHVADRLDLASRAVEQAHGLVRLYIDRGGLLALAQISEGRVALRRLHPVGDPLAGAALVEAEHKARPLDRAAMMERVDAERPMRADDCPRHALGEVEARLPHQRAVPEDPELSRGFSFRHNAFCHCSA